MTVRHGTNEHEDDHDEAEAEDSDDENNLKNLRPSTLIDALIRLALSKYRKTSTIPDAVAAIDALFQSI